MMHDLKEFLTDDRLVSNHSFDKEGFSVWKVDFKYNDELTQVFMSSNLVSFRPRWTKCDCGAVF